MEKFRAAVEIVKLKSETAEAKYLTIRADYKLHQMAFANILLIEGLDDYIQIHLKNSTKNTARSSIKTTLQKLCDKEFLGVHCPNILLLNLIKTIANRNIHLGDFIIPIGEIFKDFVMEGGEQLNIFHLQKVC